MNAASPRWVTHWCWIYVSCRPFRVDKLPNGWDGAPMTNEHEALRHHGTLNGFCGRLPQTSSFYMYTDTRKTVGGLQSSKVLCQNNPIFDWHTSYIWGLSTIADFAIQVIRKYQTSLLYWRKFAIDTYLFIYSMTPMLVHRNSEQLLSLIVTNTISQNNIDIVYIFCS